AQHQKTVGKALGDIEHLLVLGREGDAHPLAEGGAVGAAVHRHVVHLAQRDPHQLALGVLLLEVQPPQHAPAGAALVVLDELLVDARRRKIFLFVGLHEVAAVVAEHLRLNDHHAGDLGLRKSELAHTFLPLYLVVILVYIPSGLTLSERAAGPRLRPYQSAPAPTITTAAAETPRIR